jgi:hypothetical protein|eukprot:CAMPEP_0168313324 /NCGR_PEP_ID=MMETSP0210-20121227/1239_1 /TAXON_ID=40633 /ORGANISM="Condylostoma magnum, Strain COL2" /LENGTH=31 /DNA_ID= /DNA_START= /DNA_END= /DNA_ORIENTATION=
MSAILELNPDANNEELIDSILALKQNSEQYK